MSDDLRKTAFETVRTVNSLADLFPLRSPGRKALQRAVRQIRLNYIATGIDKKRLIISAIEHYHTRASDVAAVTGIGRREVDALLAEMVGSGQLISTRETQGGRPFYRFTLGLSRK